MLIRLELTFINTVKQLNQPFSEVDKEKLSELIELNYNKIRSVISAEEQDKEKSKQEREAQLQQQISSLQTQLQGELNWASQRFSNQLNNAYAEQQRQINEINEIAKILTFPVKK